MPRPSLTDEIMDMVWEYANDLDHEVAPASRTRLIARLTALETELEGYRKIGNTPFPMSALRVSNGGGGVPASYIGDPLPNMPAGLPCSSAFLNGQTGAVAGVSFVERGDEDGG